MLEEITIHLDNESSLPKYQQIANALEAYIRSYNLPVGSQLPGDRQLAEQLHTTTVTIGKSLNLLVNKGIIERKVGAGTFIRNRKKFSQTRRIGLVCHEVMRADPAYVNCFLDKFYEFWESRDYQVILLHDVPQNYEKLLHEFELSGMFAFVPSEEFHDELKNLFDRGFPLVSLGMRFFDMPDCSFGSDHEKIARNTVEYLKSSGHSNIAFIYSSAPTSALRSYRGFARAMWQSECPLNPDWVLDTKQDRSFRSDLGKILQQPVRPTAIVVYPVSYIPLIYETINDLGLKIPDDISIIGMHDEKYWSFLDPPLTVYAQRLQESTIAASEQLEYIIEHGTPMEIEERYDDAILIERGSFRKI